MIEKRMFAVYEREADTRKTIVLDGTGNDDDGAFPGRADPRNHEGVATNSIMLSQRYVGCCLSKSLSSFDHLFLAFEQDRRSSILLRQLTTLRCLVLKAVVMLLLR